MDLLTRTASLPELLTAYQDETDGSVEALTVAQNIVERLTADDVFGRLAELRDRLAAGTCHPFTDGPLNRAALDTLNDILTED